MPVFTAGEEELMATLGAAYVLRPRKNSFAAVTTLHPPGQKDTGWYCANAYLYAIQGSCLGHPGQSASEAGTCQVAAVSSAVSQSDEEGKATSSANAAACDSKEVAAAPSAESAAQSAAPQQVPAEEASIRGKGVSYIPRMPSSEMMPQDGYAGVVQPAGATKRPSIQSEDVILKITLRIHCCAQCSGVAVAFVHVYFFSTRAK
eukprot:213604-Chlamydomonas_euryale.AAC.34